MGNKKRTDVEIVAVVDKSGSMWAVSESSISNFNEWLNEQKENPDPANLTTILFSTDYKVLYTGSLHKAPGLNEENYKPAGMTALLDAVGKAIDSVSSTASKVLVLVITDGHENSSKEYGIDQIKDLIKEKEALGWEFIYLGATPDAFGEAAKSLGLHAGQTLSFDNTSRGYKNAYSSATVATSNLRNTGQTGNWKEPQ